MPKEQINYPTMKPQIREDGSTLTVPSEFNVPSGTCVHVGWNRSGWVQVSLSAQGDDFRRALDSNTDSEVYLYSEVLEREEINKMIRALRKARDQAYGSDA